MKEKIKNILLEASGSFRKNLPEGQPFVFDVNYPANPQFGNYASNIALVLAKSAKMSPVEVATQIVSNIDQALFKKIEVVKPGFINLTLKEEVLVDLLNNKPQTIKKEEKILLEYFQPNIAKPLHIGHLRTALIGDALYRIFEYLGYNVHSDTHMGDWGTQFGVLILAYKKYGDKSIVEKEPIAELNKLYVQINKEIEQNPNLHEQAKQEFVKLEQGDKENRDIWKQFVDWSMEKFVAIDELVGTKVFTQDDKHHHWPESFFEDKMPAVVEELKAKKILVQSRGAWIVDLDEQKLGVAIIVKSDGGTTYLLRDLATFIFCKEDQGFVNHLYVVDNRQSLHYKQLFAILKLMGRMGDFEGKHIDYGFISFKGEALSTRKGNMVLAEDVLIEAQTRVVKIIEEKNPTLANKQDVIKQVAIAVLKYFDLSHNRHSDIEFDWEEALSFEGNSGPYLQYSYARLASILRKESAKELHVIEEMTETERGLLFKLSIMDEKASEVLQEYYPNLFANYLYELATLINKFYHESPVLKETDETKKQFRLALAAKAKDVFGQGLQLLGIQPLEEM